MCARCYCYRIAACIICTQSKRKKGKRLFFPKVGAWSKTEHTDEFNQTEVRMNVMSNRKKRLQSNKKICWQCMYMLINMASKALLKKERPQQMTKGTFVAVEAEHVKPSRRRFTSRRHVCQRAPCWTANWRKKWIVIFLFVFCVFVQCVLINMFNSMSLMSILEPRRLNKNKWGLTLGVPPSRSLGACRLEADMATLGSRRRHGNPGEPGSVSMSRNRTVYLHTHSSSKIIIRDAAAFKTPPSPKNVTCFQLSLLQDVYPCYIHLWEHRAL